MDWHYSDPPNAAFFTSRRVLDQEAAVVRVVRDDEGDWQALDAEPRAEGDARSSLSKPFSTCTRMSKKPSRL